MADIKKDAQKAAFEAAYKAALSGKSLSQGTVNKIYKEELEKGTQAETPVASSTDTKAKTGVPGGRILLANSAQTPAAINPLVNPIAQPNKKETTEPVDNRTTQQKYDDAKKAYEDYTRSAEYLQGRQQAQKVQFGVEENSLATALLNKIGAPKLTDDAKEKELQAYMNHYKQQLDAEANQRVMDADLKELEGWSEEDRRNLDTFIAQRSTNFANALNPMLDTQFDSYVNNPVVQKYGIETVRRMAETRERQKNEEAMKAVTEAAAKQVNQKPWAGGTTGSIASIPANLVGSITSPLMYVAELGNRTGRYSTLDPNNVGNIPSAYAETVRSEVAENIRGDEENTNWLRKLAALGYQGGMSAADSAARMAVSGGVAEVSAAIASMGAFGNGLRKYSQQGASPEQAAAMALTSAGLEYITEKIPTENVLKMFKSGNKTGAVREVLKQAFIVEPTSEEVNLFAGVAAEAAILGEKSSTKQQIGEAIANGMSYQEAQKQVWKGLWQEAVQTYAVSMFSGLISSSGANVLGKIVNGGKQGPTQEIDTAAPAADVKTQEQQVIDATAAELAQNAPVQQKQPLTEGQQHMENAIAETLGLEQKAPQQVEQKPVERISLEDYANNQSPVWNNVAYEDDATKTAITQDVHNKMVESGAVVNVSEDVLKSTEQSYPDLRGMKKQERIPVLKEAVKALKTNLRQFLSSFKDQPFEFEVNGKILDAKLYNTGINEVLEKVTKEKANMLYSTEEIFKNARYLYSTPDYDGDPNVYRWNYFYTPVKIGNETVGVRIAVRDVAQGSDHTPESQIYNWGIKKDAPLGGVRPANNGSSNGASSDASTNIIQSTEAEVKGIGAAEQNFSGKAQYQDLLYEGNVQADRATDARPMELPLTDAQGGNVSAVTGNVYGSKITTDELASLMEEPVARGDFSYMPISNDKATEMAVDTIAHAGNWTEAYSNWREQVIKGNAGAEISARGALLLNKAAQDGNKELWLNTLRYMRMLGTNTAQGLQAMRLIRNLTPPDKIAFMEAVVSDLSHELKLDNELTIDPALLDEFDNAQTDEERDAIVEKIEENVAEQIPSTWLDKWTALRYTNMLGNLKTQVRNIAGNVGSAVVYRVKDTIAAGIEAIVSKLSGGKLERTKSIFTSKEMRNSCAEYFKQDRNAVNNGGKFGERFTASDDLKQGILDERKIFKSDAKNPVLKKAGDIALAPLEGYRRATNWAMNNEYFGDEAFGRAAYVRAMAGYLKAHGITDSDLSKVDSKLLDQARQHAIKEAQEATFHDNSKLAKIMSNVQKAGGVVGQGIMPFTKTPANILTRAAEFSPLGLIDSTVKTVQAIKGNEDVTGAEVINSWAKTFTGTALVALGAALFDQGLLAGGPDDDEEKEEFDKLNGAQNYAITLPNGISYTLDWLTPAAMPLFMGAQLWKAFSDQDITFAEAEEVFTSIADPMVQMSMLQGLNDTLGGIKYTENNLGQFVINSIVSYLTQGLTNTLLGQIERSTEQNRQTTFVDKDSNTPQWLQKQLGKASQKIPGWDYQQTEYINAWGETEENEGGLLYNLLSPGYLSKEEATAVSDELYRLRESTGENVFPQKPEKSLTYTDKNGVKHENYNLTAEEYDAMQRAEGQTQARIVKDLTENADYAALTDAQKAKVIGYAYEYAKEQGRVDAIADYKGYSDAWMQNISGKEAKAIVNKVVGADLSNSMSAITNAWSNKYDTAESVEALNTAYQVYSSLSMNARKTVKEDATGRTAAFLEAKNSKVSTETFVDLYKSYWELDNSSKKASEKANEWAYTLERAQESGKLTEKQKDVMKDAFGFSQFIKAEAAKFDEMTEAGLDAKTAQDTVKAVSNLTPEDGYSQVRDVQNWDAICAMTIADTEKIAAMKVYMTDKQEEKLDEVLDMGFGVDDYPELYRIADAYTSGTGKKARTIKYLQKEYGIEYAAAKKLYEVFK